jgi:hypothetical protein
VVAEEALVVVEGVENKVEASVSIKKCSNLKA